MERRALGRTGVEVSPLCLGAMMFGAWGNPDHEDSIRIIHAALDAGINFIDTADVYSRGESEEIVGKALVGRREEVVLATKFHGSMGEDPNQRGNSRRWIVKEVEKLAHPPENRLDRPLPGPPPRARHRHRGDPRCAFGPRPPGQDPLSRLLDLLALPRRRGAVDGARAQPGAFRLRAAALFVAGP